MAYQINGRARRTLVKRTPSPPAYLVSRIFSALHGNPGAPLASAVEPLRLTRALGLFRRCCGARPAASIVRSLPRRDGPPHPAIRWKRLRRQIAGSNRLTVRLRVRRRGPSSTRKTRGRAFNYRPPRGSWRHSRRPRESTLRFPPRVDCFSWNAPASIRRSERRASTMRATGAAPRRRPPGRRR
jgi:hypothetical protein